MMSLTFGLFTQVSGSGPLGPLVIILNTYVPLIFHAKTQPKLSSGSGEKVDFVIFAIFSNGGHLGYST